jgi:nucleotide-binding universal stress UspA family protein
MNSTFRKILCPIDFTEDSFAAFKAAYTLALCFSAHLIAIHVMPSLSNLRMHNNRPAHHRIAESFYGEQLDLAIRQMAQGGVPVESMVVNGYAPEEIIRVASDLSVDAIVMAEDQKNEWEKVRDGSTIDEVAGQARCPVLVLRHLDS